MKNTIHDFYAEFPSLQALSNEMENVYEKYKKKEKAIKESPRYNDNEAERAYLLEELAAEREQEMAEIEERYQAELKAIEQAIAAQAFGAVEATAEEQAAAQKLVETVRAQFAATNNVVDTAELLAMKVKTMTDIEKVALAGAIDDIEQAAQANAANNDQRAQLRASFDNIRGSLETQAAASVSKQLKAFKRLKASSSGTLRGYYDVLERVKERAASGRAVGADFYREFLNADDDDEVQ